MDAPSLLDVAHLPCDQLPPVIAVPPLRGPFDVAITPPGSKSLTNRALLLAALADADGGESTLHNALIDADDTRVMIEALRALGADIRFSADRSAPSSGTLHVRGVSGRWRVPPAGVTLRLENAGTAVRFLTAAAVLAGPGSGPITIDGRPRMRQRPIGELIGALRSLGAAVECLGAEGCPPVRMHRLDTAPAGPTVVFGATASSQFVSAMCLIAPFLPRGLRVCCAGDMTSADYVWMTLGLLRRLRVPGEPGQDPEAAAAAGLVLDWRLARTRVRAFELIIEPDASSATYFQAAAALIPGAHVEIPGLPGSQLGSLQGDVKFPLILEEAGAHFSGDPDRTIEITGAESIRPINTDLAHMPDTAMTAAVLACFASPTPDNPSATSTLRGLRTLRMKESDRLAALQIELTKLGARVEIETTDNDETLRITPPPDLFSPTPSPRHSVTPSLLFETYNDHRMAMSLALIGLRRPNVFISNPACVAKTYPRFWRDLARLYTT